MFLKRLIISLLICYTYTVAIEAWYDHYDSSSEPHRIGLSELEGCPLSMGLFDGSEFVLRDSSWQAMTIVRLLWRYGFSLYKLKTSNDDMLRRFRNIYAIQDHGLAFTNITSLLYAMYPSFSDMLKQSTRQHLEKELEISPKIVNELVTAALQSNYGQLPDIQAFVGTVAVTAASPSLWSVKDGNKQVPEVLLTKSRASVLHRHVTQIAGIIQEKPGSKMLFEVSSVEMDQTDQLYKGVNQESKTNQYSYDIRTQEYDAVIFATPLTEDKSDIKFVNMSNNYKFPGSYERIVATLVHGNLRNEVFQLPDNDKVDCVLVTTSKLLYNSISRVFPTDIEQCNSNTPNVYKLFSPKPLPDGVINLLFSDVKDTTSVDWLAYPHYPSNQNVTANFELQPGVYHINAVEWASSAMEMSAIGAKNVALLALKYLTDNPRYGNIYGSDMKKEEL